MTDPPTPSEVADLAVEELSSKLHDIYQIEAHRRGDVRHADKYEDLSEDTKEWDRVLARWILEDRQSALAALQAENEERSEQVEHLQQHLDECVVATGRGGLMWSLLPTEIAALRSRLEAAEKVVEKTIACVGILRSPCSQWDELRDALAVYGTACKETET